MTALLADITVTACTPDNTLFFTRGASFLLTVFVLAVIVDIFWARSTRNGTLADLSSAITDRQPDKVRGMLKTRSHQLPKHVVAQAEVWLYERESK